MRIFLIGAGQRVLTVMRNLREIEPSISVPLIYDPDMPGGSNLPTELPAESASLDADVSVNAFYQDPILSDAKLIEHIDDADANTFRSRHDWLTDLLPSGTNTGGEPIR